MGLDRRSIRWGAVGSAGMFAFYVSVIVVANGWVHLGDQLLTDWYFVAPIVAGFGLQVALMVELHRRHRLHAAEATTGSAAVGASAAGMLACCAHHLTEVAVFAGATGGVAFLASYRIPFMVAGLALNAAGITIAGRRLRRINHHQGAMSCVTA